MKTIWYYRAYRFKSPTYYKGDFYHLVSFEISDKLVKLQFIRFVGKSIYFVFYQDVYSMEKI